MAKLEAAVAKFDKALEDVRSAIAEQREAVDAAEAHVEESVASFDADGGAVVSEEAPTPVVEEQPEAPYAPPVV